MAPPVTEPRDVIRMEGAESRPFDITELEKDLRAMWRSTTGSPGGSMDAPRTGSVYRAAMSNLVVPVDPERHARFAKVLIEVTRRHPSRLILVEIGAHGSPTLHAEVAALCHLRPAGGYICSEQIILRGDAEAGPLVAQPMALLCRVLDRAGEQDGEMRTDLYLRICRLDPVRGMTLRKK